MDLLQRHPALPVEVLSLEERTARLLPDPQEGMEGAALEDQLIDRLECLGWERVGESVGHTRELTSGARRSAPTSGGRLPFSDLHAQPEMRSLS